MCALCFNNVDGRWRLQRRCKRHRVKENDGWMNNEIRDDFCFNLPSRIILGIVCVCRITSSILAVESNNGNRAAGVRIHNLQQSIQVYCYSSRTFHKSDYIKGKKRQRNITIYSVLKVYSLKESIHSKSRTANLAPCPDSNVNLI